MFSMFNDPALLITRIITLIIAFTVHEFSHAKVADLYGDNTPRQAGRLTLNPGAHLDIFGSLMLLFVGFGWAKPVPVNPYALSRKSGAALMFVSLAGPGSNFIMAMIAAVLLHFGLLFGVITDASIATFLPSSESFVSEFIFINLLLAFFNLIPLAPLDGEKIAEYFLPPSLAGVLNIIRPYGTIILLLLLFVLPNLGVDVMGQVIYPPIQRLFGLITF